MKKIAILLLAVCLVFTMTACGPKLPINIDGSGDSGSGSDNGSNNGDNASSNNWMDFYSSYSDAMSEASNSISDSIADEDYFYSIDMLNFIAGDLTLAFTAAFFGGDEAAVTMMFTLFGSGDVDYKESGDTATLSGVDSEGVNFEYELQYNASSQSALLTCKENGTVTEIMSICVDDEFYAKTYWSADYGNTELIYYTNGDMLMCWDGATAAAGDTLYKNVDYATSNNFAKSMPNHLNRIDGVFDGTSSGF